MTEFEPCSYGVGSDISAQIGLLPIGLFCIFDVMFMLSEL